MSLGSRLGWTMRDMAGKGNQNIFSLPERVGGILPREHLPVALLVFSSMLLLLPSSSAQPGFVSIDCGSLKNYTDSKGIQWTTDEGFISTGSNKVVADTSSTENSQQMSTARYFDVKRAKHCYKLPATKNAPYLVRAFFLPGDLEISLPAGYSFNLSIYSTTVATMSFASSEVEDAKFVEFVLAATSNQVDFCVIPLVGRAFISSLELRPLNPKSLIMPTLLDNKYLKVLFSSNFGVDPTSPAVRYPDDPHDFLWTPHTSSTTASLSTNRTLDLTLTERVNGPPQKVMQTASVATSFAGFWLRWPIDREVETAEKYFAALFFADVGSPLPTDVRSMDFLVNGVAVMQQYNITKDVKMLAGTVDVPAEVYNAVVNMTSNPISTLPALLNAGFVQAIYSLDTAVTANADVLVLGRLLQQFDISGWTGDPCLPVSWDWVGCTFVDNAFRVSQVKASSAQIVGTIPEEISLLSSVTHLWLDNNSLNGTIPDLVGMTNLRTLHLQHNQLTGSIPETLAYLPALTELFLQGNSFSGSIPQALLTKPGLNLIVDNAAAPGEGEHKGTSIGIASVIGPVAGAVAVVAIAAALLLVWLRKRHMKKASIESPQHIKSPARLFGMLSKHKEYFPDGGTAGGHGSQHVRTTQAFSYAEIRNATENFSRKIGQGGFGPVYFGKISSGDVAVKVNSSTSSQGSSEFSKEVSVLSRVHHLNLVSLVGFCDEQDHQILVYEYMPNGSLQEHLYGEGFMHSLDWRTRVNIVLNAARGLEYLHYDCNPQIIHRDVKSTNILLDGKFVAKVADFGISKVSLNDSTTTAAMDKLCGTPGYIDPELLITQKVSRKGDVYAFGVVLLEIISGRPPLDNDSPELNLVHNAHSVLQDGNLSRIVDPNLGKIYSIDAMWKLFELATHCVAIKSVDRPDMRQVVRELMDVKNLEHGRQTLQMDMAGHEQGSSISNQTTQSSEGNNFNVHSTEEQNTRLPPFDVAFDNHEYGRYSQEELDSNCRIAHSGAIQLTMEPR